MKTLPNTDLTVSTICLGTSDLGTVVPEADAFALLDAFMDHGGNFLDTAAVYANWIPGEPNVSEKTLGRWMKARGNRSQIVAATKGGHPRLSTMHISRLSPQEIVSDIDDSLHNLQVETIDLYYLHRDDPTRPVSEIVEILNDQVRAGKIRYLGCSNWRAPRIRAANAYAAEHGLAGFVADQMLWNLAVVDFAAVADKTVAMMDADLRQLHTETELAAVPYSSQAGGLFHKMARSALDRMNTGIRGMYRSPENIERFKRVQRLAQETGLSITQIVLGYLTSQPFVTVPIVGCKTLAHLEDSLSAVDTTLTPEQVQLLKQGE